MWSRPIGVIAVLVSVAGPAGANDDAGPPPQAATRSLLRELVRDPHKFESLIDPAVGLVYVDHSGGEADRPEIDRLLCTPASRARYVRELRRSMAGWIASYDADGWWNAGCYNRLGPPRCFLGGTMEFDPILALEFELDPVLGLRLRVVTQVDWVGIGEEYMLAEDRRITRTIARLRGRGCAAP